MRKPTVGAVGLASAVAIGASWVSGLHPQSAALAGVRVVAAPASPRTAAAGPPVAGATPGTGGRTGATRPGSSPSSSATAQSGSVKGALVQTPYGNVQVRVYYSGKRITRVRAIHLTDSSSTSVSISAGAEPILRQEALAAQSAQIDMVSGATYTSEGYQQSLQAAIDAAHLA